MSIGNLYHRSIRYEQIFVQYDNIKTHVRTCCHMCSHMIHMNRTCDLFVRAERKTCVTALDVPHMQQTQHIT